MSTDRDITTVIEQIKDVSPLPDLNKSLDKIISSAQYSAPEAMYLRWETLSEVLGDYIEEPIEPWHFKIFEIVQGKTIPEMMQSVFEKSEDGRYVSVETLDPIQKNYLGFLHKKGLINVAEDSITLCYRGKLLMEGKAQYGL
jgi:hypothetical protein